MELWVQVVSNPWLTACAIPFQCFEEIQDHLIYSNNAKKQYNPQYGLVPAPKSVVVIVLLQGDLFRAMVPEVSPRRYLLATKLCNSKNPLMHPSIHRLHLFAGSYLQGKSLVLSLYLFPYQFWRGQDLVSSYIYRSITAKPSCYRYYLVELWYKHVIGRSTYILITNLCLLQKMQYNERKYTLNNLSSWSLMFSAIVNLVCVSSIRRRPHYGCSLPLLWVLSDIGAC